MHPQIALRLSAVSLLSLIVMTAHGSAHSAARAVRSRTAATRRFRSVLKVAATEERLGANDDASSALGSALEQDEPAESAPPPRLFVVFGKDDDALGDVRFSRHLAHVQHLREVRTGVYEAGYFLHDDLQSAAGTMYLIGAASVQDAMNTAASDPLNEAGLFHELYVNEWERLMEPDLDNFATTPPFLVYCRDKEGAGALRASTRAKHLAWLRASSERILFVGPLLSPDPLASLEGGSSGKVGTMLLCCGESLAEVQAWAAQDPYRLAGLFAHVTVAPFTGLDVLSRALPNVPGPPMEEWWTDEEKKGAPALFASKEELERWDGKFTEDGALRSSAQELADLQSEEEGELVERWAEQMERSRLGTDSQKDESPLISFDVPDEIANASDLFWRESDEDSDAPWPFLGDDDDVEALRAAGARSQADEEDEDEGDGIELDDVGGSKGEDADGLVLDGAALDTSLQQM